MTYQARIYRVEFFDLSQLRTPGPPALSPDGRCVVVALRYPVIDLDSYRSHLWIVPTDGSVPAWQLTHNWHDSAPTWSPDGQWLAFERIERIDAGTGGPVVVGKPQLWLLPAHGGEARGLTDHPLGVARPVWSPDSTRLAYTAAVPEPGRYGTAGQLTPESEPPRRITGLNYRRDGIGYTMDRRHQVWVVSITDGDPRQVTEGDFDHVDVDWSPAGDLLTFVAARHPDADDGPRTDVWVCRPDGTGLQALTSGGFEAKSPRFSADGRMVCFVATPLDEHGRHQFGRNAGLWTVPADGSGPARQLTDQETHLARLPEAIVPADERAFFLDEHRGAVRLCSVPYGGGPPQVLVAGERQVLGSATAGATTVVTVADPYSPGEVAVLDQSGLRVLTSFNRVLAAEARTRPMRELTAAAPDGYPVHGWVVYPAGTGPHPVLLMIHGGPFFQYGWQLLDEAQAYAGAGYAVVMGNPRGSSGYGEAHARAILGDVGRVCAIDLLALLDAALASGPELDPGRVGVMGGSHGGFMTTWMAAHHGDRFRAAISERALNAIDSFTGSSDIGWFFTDSLYGPDLAQQARQSPLTYAAQITCPMLIIHSEQDWRCPLEQAQRLFVALKRRGMPVEMLVFPGEGHELSRSGRPSHRIARFEAILDWWSRHL